MIRWSESCSIYLHRDQVDFRKAINGLAVIVAEQMSLSPYDPALFVFYRCSVIFWYNIRYKKHSGFTKRERFITRAIRYRERKTRFRKRKEWPARCTHPIVK